MREVGALAALLAEGPGAGGGAAEGRLEGVALKGGGKGERLGQDTEGCAPGAGQEGPGEAPHWGGGTVRSLERD